MPRLPLLTMFLAPAVALAFLAANPSNDLEAPDQARLSGGRTTVLDETLRAFSFSARGLSENEAKTFFQGSRLFNRDFVSGLGPFYATRSCLACHFMDGRAEPPASGQPAISLVLKLSVPGKIRHGEPLPEPIYGTELSPLANAGFAEEGKVFVDYENVSGKYGDGSSYLLLKPKIHTSHLGYGDLASNVLFSPRIAPALIGLGLLEAVPEKTILAFAGEQTSLGLRGKPNRVWDYRKNRFALGRFGWKANEPSVEQQVAHALSSDLGVTSELFPEENVTAVQRRKRAEKKPAENTPPTRAPEIGRADFDRLVFYSRTLAVPARCLPSETVAKEKIALGETLFQSARCAACHRSFLDTGSSDISVALATNRIHPYTDLLLHDLGEGLADNRPDFEASGSQWRTAPLWGIGMIPVVNEHSRLLHDGRARGVAEAILWHGGEAEGSKEIFRNMTRSEREALTAFVMSL